MNLETARIFCDLAELKNFSRTAEVHGISQSAVSQQLIQLEIGHNVQLIDRKKRPIELTAAGQVFYQASKEILERYGRLTRDLTALKQSSYQIRLAAIFSIGMYTLQPYIQKFISIYPDVNLSVDYYGDEEIYDKLLRGIIDIGVVAVPCRDRYIEMFPFENEPLVLACSPAHPFASRIRLDIQELHGEKFIAFGKGVPTRRHIDDILSRYGVSVRLVMEIDNTETIKRAVEINSGISILPAPTMRTELANGTLKAVELSNESFIRPTGILIRKENFQSKAGQYLLGLLRKE